jgi:hypothetical protein
MVFSGRFKAGFRAALNLYINASPACMSSRADEAMILLIDT